MCSGAHFYMPSGINNLGCAYSHGVDFHRLRAALAKERDRAGMTLDDLAEKSGLNRATIHSIENIKREPDLKPELETVERLASAMELTLSEFFERIEIAPSDLPSINSPVTTTAASDRQPDIAKGNPHGSGGEVSRSALPLDDIGALLARNLSANVAVTRSLDALVAELRAAREQATAPRARKSARAARSRKTG